MQFMKRGAAQLRPFLCHSWDPRAFPADHLSGRSGPSRRGRQCPKTNLRAVMLATVPIQPPWPGYFNHRFGFEGVDSLNRATFPDPRSSQMPIRRMRATIVSLRGCGGASMNRFGATSGSPGLVISIRCLNSSISGPFSPFGPIPHSGNGVGVALQSGNGERQELFFANRKSGISHPRMDGRCRVGRPTPRSNRFAGLIEHFALRGKVQFQTMGRG